MAERLSILGLPLPEHHAAQSEDYVKQTCTAGKIAVEEAIMSEERLGRHVTYAIRVRSNTGL